MIAKVCGIDQHLGVFAVVTLHLPKVGADRRGGRENVPPPRAAVRSGLVRGWEKIRRDALQIYGCFV
jgi:hypothetical protein